MTQDEYPKILSNIEPTEIVQARDNIKPNSVDRGQAKNHHDSSTIKKEEAKHKIQNENVYQSSFYPNNFDKPQSDSLERDHQLNENSKIEISREEFKKTLHKFTTENEYDDLSQPKSRDNSSSVNRKKKKKREFAYEESKEVKNESIPAEINITQVTKDKRSNASSLDRSIGKINNPPSVPNLSKSPERGEEHKDEKPDIIWGKTPATPMKIDDPADEYSPNVKRQQNTERIAKARDKKNGSVQERTNNHFEEEKHSYTEKKNRNNVQTRSVAAHSEYSEANNQQTPYSSKNKIGNDKLPKATPKSESKSKFNCLTTSLFSSRAKD